MSSIYQSSLPYYVYAYLRTSDLTPYYIGKGKNGRAWDKNHTVIIPKNKSRIVILESNLTVVGALALERRMIRWYGRKDLGTGILRNKTDGGDGNPGRKMTSDHKLKINNGRKNKVITPEFRKLMSDIKKGTKFSAEHKSNLSKSHKGKKLSDDHKNKISLIKSGICKPKIQCPHCNKFGGLPQMKQWHFNNCKNRS